MRQLMQDPEWSLVELDGVAALFLRSREENTTLIRAAQASLGVTPNRFGSVTDTLEPRRDPGWIEKWFGRRRFPWEAYGRTNALGRLGFHAAARGEARRALVEADRDYAPLAANYAEASYRTGLIDEALIWYRRTLELEPNYPGATARITEITNAR
jgi:tetratricopeptide (TPR) repeat protein